MFAKRLVLALALIAVLIAAGCGQKEEAATTTEAGEEPYVIGAIFSTTGPAAALGVPERDTVEMLEKQINDAGGIDGHPIDVVIYDDGCKPDQAVKACQELLDNDKVLAIIGPTLSGTSLAIVDSCGAAGMPLVSCAASAKIIEPVADRKYVFKTAQTDTLAVKKILSYLNEQGITKIAFINDGNAFGQSGRGQWEALSKGAGITTLAMESFVTDDTDMTSQLTSIKAKNPEAVVCWGTDQGSHQVARDMRKLGMKQPLIMSHGVANRAFITSAGSAAEGVIFPSGKLIVADQIPDDDPQKEVLIKYRDDYIAEYSEDKLSTFGGHAWDAFMVTVKALEEAGADHEKIRDAVENTTDFVGITGVFSFSDSDHGGLTEDAFVMVTIKNGDWVLAQ